MILTCKDFLFDFSKKTFIMGILNVTPDSFSDGGQFFNAQKATDHALRMIDDGADIIDIGGESTRPGSESVSGEEELRRIIPVIESLSGKTNIPLSVDTYKANVAKAALEAGANIVNDISGLRFDKEMAGVVAEKEAPLIVMHIKGTPKEMQKAPVYDDILTEIADYLSESIETAMKAGIKKDKIIIDPGIGFGKTFDHNLQIIDNLDKFKFLGKPILVGTSRKAFIGSILGDVPSEKRLMGTAATVAVSIMHGANIVRVHDVAEMAEVAKVTDAIRKEQEERNKNL